MIRHHVPIGQVLFKWGQVDFKIFFLPEVLCKLQLNENVAALQEKRPQLKACEHIHVHVCIYYLVVFDVSEYSYLKSSVDESIDYASWLMKLWPFTKFLKSNSDLVSILQ